MARKNKFCWNTLICTYFQKFWQNVELLYFVFTGDLFHNLLVMFLFIYFTSIQYDELYQMSFHIKAMIIVACNGSGDLSSIFDGNVFRKVLSIFMTAAILKLAQGICKTSWNKCFCYNCKNYVFLFPVIVYCGLPNNFYLFYFYINFVKAFRKKLSLWSFLYIGAMLHH